MTDEKPGPCNKFVVPWSAIKQVSPGEVRISVTEEMECYECGRPIAEHTGTTEWSHLCIYSKPGLNPILFVWAAAMAAVGALVWWMVS